MSHQARDRLVASDHYATAASHRTGAWQRLRLTLAVWRGRVSMRRRLADMDARSLRDAGISPAAAAYEAAKPFWKKIGFLR